MNCKRAQLYTALRAGGDLDDAGLSDLQSHLNECPPCRSYAERMTSPLQDCDLRSAVQLQESLWPDLFEKLAPRPGRSAPDFHGWWAASAVVVACFAIGLFWHDEARSGHWNRPVAVGEFSDADRFPPVFESDRRDQPHVSMVLYERPDNGMRDLFPSGSEVGRQFWLLRPVVEPDSDDSKQ